MEKLTDEYTTQINKLQENRDKVLEQNTELIKLLQKERDRVDYLNSKFEVFLEKIIQCNSKGNSENNINVK